MTPLVAVSPQSVRLLFGNFVGLSVLKADSRLSKLVQTPLNPQRLVGIAECQDFVANRVDIPFFRYRLGNAKDVSHWLTR
jgi:hypothetical protein